MLLTIIPAEPMILIHYIQSQLRRVTLQWISRKVLIINLLRFCSLNQ
jgi:hypothetical protein